MLGLYGRARRMSVSPPAFALVVMGDPALGVMQPHSGVVEGGLLGSAARLRGRLEASLLCRKWVVIG